MMYELTNEERKYFCLPEVTCTQKRVELPKGPYDDHVTVAYIEGRRIVKVIMVSDKPGKELYREYEVDETLSSDGTKIMPKTDKGKPQNFTAPVLTKKTPIGMALSYSKGYVYVTNNTAQQDYYRSGYSCGRIVGLDAFARWVSDWCRCTGEHELLEIEEFSRRTRSHVKYSEGDFFRYRLARGLYGYGRILVDYAKMRKEGIPFWDIFCGKPLCVAVYHIATKDAGLRPEELCTLTMLPSQMIMDNIFYYGECEIIGNMPISDDEDNYTVHYEYSNNISESDKLCYQCGKTFVTRLGAPLLYDGFGNGGIGWSLDVKLDVLVECIRQGSNAPYWSMIPAWRAERDIRNPKFKKQLERVQKQMGVKRN